MGHWIAVRLRQPAPNVDAIGAWVEARIGDRTVVREVTVGGGHAGGQLGSIHIGLGDEEQVDVRVQWPDGEIGPWMTLPADRVATIDRGARRGDRGAATGRGVDRRRSARHGQAGAVASRTAA